MDDWVFDLDSGTGEPRLPVETEEYLPFIGDTDRWRQFSDPVVYELDSLMRQWLERMCQNKEWVRSARKRRYTFSMIFEQLFGRSYDQVHGDAAYTHKLTKIITWYSSRIQKGGYLHGRMRSKTIYTISPNRYHTKPPYSLKLRLKWFGEQGIVPTHTNMALPKDRLAPGHARDPKTDANMERRRQETLRRRREQRKENGSGEARE